MELFAHRSRLGRYKIKLAALRPRAWSHRDANIPFRGLFERGNWARDQIPARSGLMRHPRVTSPQNIDAVRLYARLFTPLGCVGHHVGFR